MCSGCGLKQGDVLSPCSKFCIVQQWPCLLTENSGLGVRFDYLPIPSHILFFVLVTLSWVLKAVNIEKFPVLNLVCNKWMLLINCKTKTKKQKQQKKNFRKVHKDIPTAS